MVGAWQAYLVRIALISDIHGNTVSLDAVIADLDAVRPDMVVCLGDIAAGGPDPAGAVERVVEFCDIAVQGNTDAGLVDMPTWWRDPGSIGLPEDAIPGMEVTVWSAGQLHDEHRAYLAGLPLVTSVELGQAGPMLACHGSPRSFDELITSMTTTDELDDILSGVSAAIVAGGHTHVPLFRRHRGIILVNPGSVGMPFSEYGYAGGVQVYGHAEYAVLSVTGSLVDVEHRQVPVASESLEALVERTEMPNGEWWIGLRSPGFSTEI